MARNFREMWWRRILDDPAVTGDVLTVALIISTQAWWQDGSRAVISTARVAEALGVSTRTVKRHTQRLRGLGYLELTERGHRRGDGAAMANVYALSLGDIQVTPREESSRGHPGDPLSDSQGDKTESQGDKTESQGDTQVSHPSVFPSVNPSPFPESEDQVAHARARESDDHGIEIKELLDQKLCRHCGYDEQLCPQVQARNNGARRHQFTTRR
jgi:DNA-binding transcriptional MocR family regulator